MESPPSSHQGTTREKALERAVARLSLVVEEKRKAGVDCTCLIDDHVDTRALLSDIRRALVLTPTVEEKKHPSPFQVWRARTGQEEEEGEEMETTEETSEKEDEQQGKEGMDDSKWENFVGRLYESMERHEVQIAEAQRGIIARELSELTFTPKINRKSLVGMSGEESSLSERAARLQALRQTKLEQERSRIAEKELEGVTFQPKVNPASFSAPSRVMSPSGAATAELAQRLRHEREAFERENLTFSPAINPKSRAMNLPSRVFAKQQPKSPSSLSSPNEFQPKINPRSIKMMSGGGGIEQNGRSPVHERLYASGMRRHQKQGREASPPMVLLRRGQQQESPAAEKNNTNEKKKQNVIVYDPSLDFMLRALDKT